MTANANDRTRHIGSLADRGSLSQDEDLYETDGLNTTSTMITVPVVFTTVYNQR